MKRNSTLPAATALAMLPLVIGIAAWVTPLQARPQDEVKKDPDVPVGGAYRVGNGVTQPSVIHKVDPEYSEKARQAKFSGNVLLQLVVDVDGKAKNIKIVKGVGLGLDEKAIEAVQKWKFVPGKKNGEPVPVFASVSINFQLLDHPPQDTPATPGPGQTNSKELRPLRLTGNTAELPIQAAAISPDGKFVAYSDALGIHVRTMGTGENRLLPGTRGHLLVQWAPDSAGLQTRIPDDGETRNMIVSLSGGEMVSLPGAEVFVASPDGTHRITMSADRQQVLVQDPDGRNSRSLWKVTGRDALREFHWSPDSRQIVVLSAYGRESVLETLEIAGGRTNVLVPASRALWIRSVAWPKQDRLIIVVDEPVGPGQIASNLWEVRPDAAPRKLTAWADFPIRPGSLTTDGKSLVFVRSFRQWDVYVAPIEAGGTRMGAPRRLTLDLGDDYPTGWTRDSKSVILTSNRNGPQNIFRQDLDKQTADPLVALPGIQALPRVTPDGESILFRSAVLGTRNYRLMRAPIAGGNPEPLPEAPNVADFRCSPAGPCSIVQRTAQDVISELDPVKGIGREIYRGTRSGFPDLSPDGQWLATTSGRGSEARIVLRSFSTGAVVREIPIGGVTNLTTLDFASDGKGFFSCDASPDEDRLLYISLSGQTSVLWRQPPSAMGIWGVPSPNGKYLALMMYTDDSNVYAVQDIGSSLSPRQFVPPTDISGSAGSDVPPPPPPPSAGRNPAQPGAAWEQPFIFNVNNTAIQWAVTGSLKGRAISDGKTVEISVEHCEIHRPKTFDQPKEVIRITAAIVRRGQNGNRRFVLSGDSHTVNQMLQPDQTAEIEPFQLRIRVSDYPLVKGDSLAFSLVIPATYQGRATVGTVPIYVDDLLPVTQVAAFCADTMEEFKKPGTPILQAYHVCYDSSGRTRSERWYYPAADAPKSAATLGYIEIRDPVANRSYRLDPRTKKARRQNDRLGGVLGGIVGGLPGSGPVLTPVESDKTLGIRNINGVEADGKLHTTVYPAGYQGRAEEVTTTEETWYSFRIQAQVRRVRTDPRNGDYEYQVKNIELGEPDAGLFRIPDDYELVDTNSGSPHEPLL